MGEQQIEDQRGIALIGLLLPPAAEFLKRRAAHPCKLRKSMSLRIFLNLQAFATRGKRYSRGDFLTR